jgi:dolichol-phosphate mannosyltransferase
MIQGDLLIVIPTYNEASSIPVLIPSIFELMPEANILIVDDGSPDGTFQICQELAAVDKRISVINRGRKQGLATAFVYGFRWGLDHGYEAIAEMDADGSHQPTDLLRLVEVLNADPELQMVTGSRWVSGGIIENWAWHRTVLSQFANRYAKAILSLPVNDVTAGFRVFRRGILSKIDLASLESKGFCFHIEMTNIVTDLGVPIQEVPITFIERKQGASKMSFEIALESLLRVTLWGIQKKVRKLLH